MCYIETLHPDWRYRLSEFTNNLPRPRTMAEHHDHYLPNAQRQYRPLLDAVTQAVLTQLEGTPKHNGWIAARCPCQHCRDRPGMHFGFNPDSGTGYCFGKHGKLSLTELAELLGIHTR